MTGRQSFALFFLLLFSTLGIATPFSSLTSFPTRLKSVWQEGYNELYLTGYAWHNRFTYAKSRWHNYNEAALGGGLGKGLYDEDGDWHGLYAFAFLDSHTKVEPIAGYAFQKILNLNTSTRFGIGFTVFVTARSDIFHNIPFPGALPWVSLNYKRATLAATYIPGASNAGNVLFLVGKWRFT